MRLLIVFVICLLYETAVAKNAKQGKYTVVGPGTVHPNHKYNVAVAVHQTNKPVKINIGLSGPSYKAQKTVELPAANKVHNVEFDLPDLEKGDYKLTAEGVEGIIFKNETALNYDSFKAHVVIQTDKGKYKPGDTINYRVIFLDENLKPTKVDNEAVVWFEDNKRNRIKEERDLNVVRGVFTGSLDLSEYALEGNWRLGVTYGGPYDQEVYFEVKKYVLPKYEMSVESTSNVAVQDGDMLITVRANYTYGKPVEGKVTVIINFERWGRYYAIRSISDGKDAEEVPPEPPIIIKKTDMVNGKAKINVNVKQYEPFMTNKVAINSLEIIASVEEEFTGVQINGTTRSLLYPYRYHMNCISYDTCYTFYPGKDKEITYKLEYIDNTPLNDTKSPVKLTFTEHIQSINYWQTDPNEVIPVPEIKDVICTYIGYMNSSGYVTFKVNLPDLEDFEKFAHYYKQSLEYAGETREIYNTYAYREPKKIEVPDNENEEPKDFFTLEPQYEKDNYGYQLGDTAVLKLNSSRPLKYFILNIVARGNLYKSERIDLPKPSKTYDLKIPTTFTMTPYSRFYVFYVSEKGELFTVETTIYTEVKLQNQIEITAPEEVKPGDMVPLKIKTEPNSFVGLMAIDQSVILLAENNDVQENQFNWRLGTYDTNAPVRSFYDRKPGDYTGVFTLTNANWTDPAPRYLLRKTFSASAQKAGGPAMGAMGFAMPESDGGVLRDQMAGGGSGAITIRKNFAETWIFDNIENTESGEITWSKKVPDTITSWLISGFSISDEKGIGVTRERTKMRTFQPFFVAIRLPYSVKRDEVIRVPALVFNYLEKDLDVQVTLDNTDGEYEFTEPNNDIEPQKKITKVVRVPANAARGVDFLIRPKVVGNTMLKFTAISPIAGDAVYATLKVEPEGVTQYANRAYFVNLLNTASEFKDTFELILPEKIVPDSEHIEFSVVGDLFGPTLNNLDNLLRLPMGCGEQTTSQFVLNVIILQYLESLGKDTDYLKHQVKYYLESGYQKLLRYLHDDGAFSSFGPGTVKYDDVEYPRNGSTWLTAYVMKTLSDASKYTKIDDKIFQNGYSFLASKQAENGSFSEAGEYFYNAQRSNVVLTSKVVLAFLANATYAEQYKDVVDKALANIKEELKISDKVYDKSLATVVLQKAKDPSYSQYLSELKALAQTDVDRKWWSEKQEKKPQGIWWWWRYNNDIEITSNILLAMLGEENFKIDSVLPIIKWLVAQRNSYGGFLGTQDTVAGLQALTKFALKSKYQPAIMTIDMKSQGTKPKQASLKTTKENALVMQTEEFPAETKSIEFVAKGTGAALIQVSYQYNVAEKEKEPTFKVEATVQSGTPASQLIMNVCSEYIGDDDKSNMAILEASLPSGYTVDTEQYEKIEAVPQVRLVESKNLDSTVVVYFESLKKGEQVCFDISAYKSYDVSEHKPSSIVLYDYYDADSKGNTFYELNKE